MCLFLPDNATHLLKPGPQGSRQSQSWLCLPAPVQSSWTAHTHLTAIGATHLPCRLPSLPVQFWCCPLPDSGSTSALQAALDEQAKLDNAEKDAETERRSLKSLLEFNRLEKEQDNRVARMQDIAVQRGQVGGWGVLRCTA